MNDGIDHDARGNAFFDDIILLWIGDTSTTDRTRNRLHNTHPSE